MKPIFFENQWEFRKWLEDNHQSTTEILVGFYKIGSEKPTLTWSESVDQALCFGWIDGVRKSIDTHSYQIRFTPRKVNSIWSLINIEKIELLQQKGLLHASGLAIFEQRKSNASDFYTVRKEPQQLAEEFLKQFQNNKKAWNYFKNLAPSYQKTSINWVMSAKQKSTQEKRLAELIASSESETNAWKDNKYKK